MVPRILRQALAVLLCVCLVYAQTAPAIAGGNPIAVQTGGGVAVPMPVIAVPQRQPGPAGRVDDIAATLYGRGFTSPFEGGASYGTGRTRVQPGIPAWNKIPTEPQESLGSVQAPDATAAAPRLQSVPAVKAKGVVPGLTSVLLTQRSPGAPAYGLGAALTREEAVSKPVVPSDRIPNLSGYTPVQTAAALDRLYDGAVRPGAASPVSVPDPIAPAGPVEAQASPLRLQSVPAVNGVVPLPSPSPVKDELRPSRAALPISQREKASSPWTFIKANRFLIAAAAGAAIGLAGVNLAMLPVLSFTPGLFFGALPWLAAPFIGLNVFKSFSHYSVVKESRTLLGFLVITVAGLVISAGTTVAMTALLPVVDPASFEAAAIPGLATGGFSPMQFMLPIIALFTGAALLYKQARGVNEGGAARTYGPGWKGTLARFFDRAVGLVVNARTAPFLERAGKLGEKGTDFINKAFPRFIDIIGIPAVAVLLSMTMATGGLGLLNAFGGYYITAFAGMAVGLVALLAAYFAFGARGKDFRELFKAALFGFSISSSSATMPTEKETLKAMGVSRKTRDTVVPLGGVFNMFGTALYMGLTAFYALSMFGAAPTPMQYLSTALAVLVIAMGAPGIPASNITLLDPVLRQTGLQSGEIGKIYTMILPADRILDMAQTALNVLGDMLPAVEQDRKRLRYNRAKRIREIRRKRAEEEGRRGTPTNP